MAEVKPKYGKRIAPHGRLFCRRMRWGGKADRHSSVPCFVPSLPHTGDAAIMSQRISVKDVGHLRSFRDKLVRFNHTLRDEHAAVSRAWKDQRSNWQDPQAEKLDEELSALWAGIEKYLQKTQDHEHYLRRLIEQLEAAGQLRL